MRTEQRIGRSRAEVAFMVMRVLVTARLLWGAGGAVPVDALPALAGTDGAALAGAVDRLCDEGIAEHAGINMIRLTEGAASDLLPWRNRPEQRGSDLSRLQQSA